MWFPQPDHPLRRLFAGLTEQTFIATLGVADPNLTDYLSILLSRFLIGWDPGSEYHPSGDLMPPDLEPVFYGHEGYLRLWRYWLDAFEDIRWEPEEILDLGDAFLVVGQQSGHGSGSGVAVSVPVFQLFRLRRGLVVRQEDFMERSKALEAARVPE